MLTRKVRAIFILLSVLPFAILCSHRIATGQESRAALQHQALDQSAQPSPTISPSHVAVFGSYTENINGVPLYLARVPQGTFLMGNDRSPNPEEKPAHLVNLKSFYIGQYEVTRKQWNIVASSAPKVSRDLRMKFIDASAGFSEDTPADVVFWGDAVEFCERLSRMTGVLYRLPSEAEWEYACRADSVTEYSFGDAVRYDLAHFKDIQSSEKPFYIIPVGGKGYANSWGLFDMHGNVAEFTADVEHSNYVGAPTDGSAWMEGGKQRGRILRGGMYDSREEFGRSSARIFWDQFLAISGVGLRVVAEINPVIGNGKVTAVSAASYSGISQATDSIVALFGSNLFNTTQAASALPLPFTLAGTSVNLKDSSGNEYLAPLFFASSGQINFVIPPGLALGRGTVSVVTNGVIHSTGLLEITNVNPGLFAANATGKDVAAALALRVKSNGEQIYEPIATFDTATNRFVPVPIDLSNTTDQDFLVLFGTGFRHRASLANASATVGGRSVEVLFAGAQGDLLGVDQCNLRLPASLAGSGDLNISLTVDGQTSNTVQVRIK